MNVAPTENTTGRENGRRRPRGYDPTYRPTSKIRARLDQVREVLAEYDDHLPLTIRQIFYRLVATHGYAKTEQAYDRLSETLNRARRAKLIPFEAIRDDGVVTIDQIHYASVEDFHDETAIRVRAYRRDRQAGQRKRIELWCEAAGMLRQLERVASNYSVPVYSAGGFGSLTANYEIALRALGRLVPTVLLHAGDYDPSGESTFTAMSEDAVAFVEADRTLNNIWINPVRVALTCEQVEDYGLETAPPKKSDRRSGSWDGETCQLEALAPDTLAEIVTEAIESHLDLDIYRRQLECERADRAHLLALPPGEAAS